MAGDRGYGLERCLQIPFSAPTTGAERLFNDELSKTRRIVETMFGALKNSFRCLLAHRTLHYSPSKAGDIINACAVLHNVRVSDNSVEEEIVEFGNYTLDAAIRQDRAADGAAVRQQIVANYFTD